MRALLNLAALYLRCSPIEKGRWRLLRWALALSQRTKFEHELRVFKTRSGFLMNVDLGDWLGRHVFVSGEYEPATTAVMEALLQPGDTMLDIGANAGYFTLLAAQRVGPQGTVIAFEPMPSVNAILRKNIELNSLAQVQVRTEALYCEDGVMSFNEGPADHCGISSLRAIDRVSNTIRVVTARGDNVLAADLPIALIKIDIEGAELHALQGLEQTLKRHTPDLIVEVTDEYLRGMGHTAADMHQFLNYLGYRMYAISEGGLHEIRVGQIMPSAQFNALFTTKSDIPCRMHCFPERETPSSTEKE